MKAWLAAAGLLVAAAAWGYPPASEAHSTTPTTVVSGYEDIRGHALPDSVDWPIKRPKRPK